MKQALSLILPLALIAAFAVSAAAQEANEERSEESTDAAVSVADLRSKLQEVQAREAELQARAKQIDENLKPENIARSLAGIGSTKPEELRELRRRELTIEKEGIANQLRLLATSRTRLEGVIRAAEAREYQQTADGSLNQVGANQGFGNPRWLAIMMVAALGVLGAVLTLVLIRKRAVS